VIQSIIWLSGILFNENENENENFNKNEMTKTKPSVHSVYLHLGSNIGDRLGNLLKAKFVIQRKIGHIQLLSQVYETEAWGKTNQSAFYNQALLVRTEMTASQVLNAIHEIENQLGRQRTEHWGPRTIDIDILFFEHEIINTKKLTLPHPRLHERNFVLVPLEEIAPSFIHPILNKSVKKLRKSCPDTLEVRLMND